jgi:hypothetical protein
MSDTSDPRLRDDHEDDLRRIAEQLRAEEGSAAEARLSSLESFELWVRSNPLLQQSAKLNELISAYGPALLEILKRFL